MLTDLEVNSPKKILKSKDEESEENENEYIITNLIENKKHPKLLIRIPKNVNKLLSKEEKNIKYIENIKSDYSKKNKIDSFKIENNDENEEEEEEEKIKTDNVNDYNSEYSDDPLLNKLKKEDYIDDNILTRMESNFIEKYNINYNDEHLSFLRNHTSREFEEFINKKNTNICDNITLNDIIKIDYEKLNEKNIIPYFLTNMFDNEQKKKREKMKEELNLKRKESLEKLKRKNSNKKKRKSSTKKEKGNIESLKSKNLKLQNNKLKDEVNNEEKLKLKYNENDINDDIDNENDTNDSYDESPKNRKDKKKNKNDMDFEEYEIYNELVKNEEINIHKDSNLYGIEGSSDSEGIKSEEDATQEEDLNEDFTKEGKKKKKKTNKDTLNSDNIDDIVDSSIEKLISYDYYSSINVSDFVKPNYKIKELHSFIPVYDNIDNYDDIKKLQYLIKNLPYTHIKEKRSLYYFNVKQFIKWKTYLLNNINICLYGVGSKFHLLNLFTNICLNDGHKCIIYGFEQEINFDEILLKILEHYYKYKAPKNLKTHDLMYKLIDLLNDSLIPIYFVIHNLDNIKLYIYYQYFSFLSKFKNIYFIASIDDVSFELNMYFKDISDINFIYIKCHTWIDYRYEIIKLWNIYPPEWVYNKKNDKVDKYNNIQTILNALNINHKRLFKIIASMQLENLDKGIYGVDKDTLLKDKRLFTIGSSAIRINTLLVEFVSHNVITETRLKEGNTFLKINADKEELKKLVDSL